uniref:Uncharacterized protein n=1 Tax=viral metagenome TaxID=1070528 RepID=A0A6M3XRA6_9ZZZZ
MAREVSSAEEIEEIIREVKTASKVLISLYPDAAAHSLPKCAGIVLRRFQLRERDMLGFLELYKSREG